MAWPPYANETDPRLVLTTPPEGLIHAHNHSMPPTRYTPHCALWDDYYNAGQPPPAEGEAHPPESPGDVEPHRRALRISRRRAVFDVSRDEL